MVNLPIEYSDKPVTPFGGMALMKRFMDQTGIRERLAELELPRGGSNRAYDAEHIIEGFWLGIWTGASRYIHCDWLRQDETLAAIFGYECLPSQSAYAFYATCSDGTGILAQAVTESSPMPNLSRLAIESAGKIASLAPIVQPTGAQLLPHLVERPAIGLFAALGRATVPTFDQWNA